MAIYLSEVKVIREGHKTATRELDAENLGHDEDWEGHCAAVTCPACGKVNIVIGARVDLGPRECPNCGRSTAQCYGTRLGGGSVSIAWRGAAERQPGGLKRILGMMCLVLGSTGVVLGITLLILSLVAQAMEGGVEVLRAAFAMFLLAGCLVLAGVKLQH